MQTFVPEKFYFGMNGFFLHIMLLIASFMPCSGGVAGSGEPVGEAVRHPFYVSVTELTHNTKENSLEISCKMFADDCEKTLSQITRTEVDISHPKDVKQLEKWLSEYIQKHLQVKINGKPVALQYVGYEKESESVWCYLQVSGVKSVSKLELTNSLLYDLYNNEINIMHVTAGGNRKSVRVTYPETSASVSF